MFSAGQALTDDETINNKFAPLLELKLLDDLVISTFTMENKTNSTGKVKDMGPASFLLTNQSTNTRHLGFLVFNMPVTS